MKALKIAAVLGLILAGHAFAAGSALPAPAVCRSFSAINAENAKDHPDLQVVKLTAAQKDHLAQISNATDLDDKDAYVVSFPGSHTVAIVLVRDDCIEAAAMVPAAALAEILGTEI